MSKIVAEVIRNDRVESIHRGHVAVVDAEGKILAFLGDVQTYAYIRSAAKPVQAMPLLESRAVKEFAFTDEQLAVMMASHNGEDFHLEAVKSILQKARLSDSDLKCGFHLPMHQPSADEFIRQNREQSALYNNCSGKHSGMLALAQYHGWPLETYLETSHPVQKRIKEKISLFSGLTKEDIPTGMDGCSAPAFYLPVKNMAMMYAKLAAGKIGASDKVFKIMSANSKMVAGSGRFDTAVMQVMGGYVISKIGAEGIRCLGMHKKEPLGVALKIEDGNARVSAAVMLEILVQLDLISPKQMAELADYRRPVLFNCAGLEIGEIRTTFNLKSF